MQKGALQLRIAPSGNVIGYDMACLIPMADALGYNRQAFITLIGYAEGGMMQGMKESQHGE